MTVHSENNINAVRGEILRSGVTARDLNPGYQAYELEAYLCVRQKAEITKKKHLIHNQTCLLTSLYRGIRLQATRQFNSC